MEAALTALLRPGEHFLDALFPSQRIEKSDSDGSSTSCCVKAVIHARDAGQALVFADDAFERNGFTTTSFFAVISVEKRGLKIGFPSASRLTMQQVNRPKRTRATESPL